MNREEIEAFLGRDWGAVEAESARFWAERKKELSPAELFALVDRFNAGIREMRPEWPTEAERDADLVAHAELTRLLDRANRGADL